MKIHVLNHGYIELINHMNDDLAIVNAARISYGSESTQFKDQDEVLLRYLMRHQHWTPFEMVQLQFRIMIPMDTWRQMVRHRTASINEYSTRYKEAIDLQE